MAGSRCVCGNANYALYKFYHLDFHLSVDLIAPRQVPFFLEELKPGQVGALF